MPPPYIDDNVKDETMRTIFFFAMDTNILGFGLAAVGITNALSGTAPPAARLLSLTSVLGNYPIYN